MGVALSLGGADAAASLAACLSEVEVRQALNAPALAILTFTDPPANATGLELGSHVELKAPDGEPLFDGEITSIRRSVAGTRERSLTVRAYDRLHRLRKQQSLRELPNAGLSDIASLVASAIGVSVDEAGAASDQRPVVIQHRQSDFDLLAELARDGGKVFALREGQLKLMTLSGDGGEPVRLVVGETILEAMSDISAEPMRKSSEALGWDVASNEVHKERAGTAAQDSLEMRMEAISAFDGLGQRFLVNRLCGSAGEVRGFAQADMDDATARGLKFEALCEGDAALRPGRAVDVAGLGSEADGPFVVASATHRFDAAGGYTTRVSTALPRNAPPPSRATSATIGVVTDTDDPETRARVKVRLPAFGDVASDWMPVLSLGAGRTKGFTIMPEPDDEVLVLLPDGNPSRGIVLGGLYGINAPPGERPTSGARAFVLHSPAGPELLLDGIKPLIRIDSGDGDKVELGPDGALFRAARDLTIEAPGHAIKIRAARVDFEKA